jgi:hypothetical protein
MEMCLKDHDLWYEQTRRLGCVDVLGLSSS